MAEGLRNTFKYKIRQEPRVSRSRYIPMRRKFNVVTRRLSKLTRKEQNKRPLFSFSPPLPAPLHFLSAAPLASFPFRCLEVFEDRKSKSASLSRKLAAKAREKGAAKRKKKEREKKKTKIRNERAAAIVESETEVEAASG